MPKPRPKADGAAYELRFRLERSYRPLGYAFLLSGLVGFGVAIMGALLLLLVAGPALGLGVWLLTKDIREYLIVEPRTRKLRLVMAYGRGLKERRSYNLREFVRLETAQYDARPKGVRCMLLLFRGDGSVEKIDDRIHEPSLVELCRQVAEAAQLDFVDKGRIDQPRAPRLGAEGEAEPAVLDRH